MNIINIVKVSTFTLMLSGVIYAEDGIEPGQEYNSTSSRTSSCSDRNSFKGIPPISLSAITNKNSSSNETSGFRSALSFIFGSEKNSGAENTNKLTLQPPVESPTKIRIKNIKAAVSSDDPNALRNILANTSLYDLSGKNICDILSSSPPDKQRPIKEFQTLQAMCFEVPTS